MQLYLVILLAKHLTNAHTARREGKGAQGSLWGSASRGDLGLETKQPMKQSCGQGSAQGWDAQPVAGREMRKAQLHSCKEDNEPLILEAG